MEAIQMDIISLWRNIDTLYKKVESLERIVTTLDKIIRENHVEIPEPKELYAVEKEICSKD